MSVLDIGIDGLGFWTPGWPDWNAARAGLLGGAEADPTAIKPSPGLLASAERRRAPLPVLLACEISAQACAASGYAIETLPSVFTSTHGDLIITDYMCSVLVDAPSELSPIRFHNSVHNAPAGYWTIAAHCHAASTSISSWHSSFATALFEAAVQANAEQTPVLLAAYDGVSPGPLGKVSPSTIPYGVALVVTPGAGHDVSMKLRFGAEEPVARTSSPLPAAFAEMARSNPMAAQSLPLLMAIAQRSTSPLSLAISATTALHVELCA